MVSAPHLQQTQRLLWPHANLGFEDESEVDVHGEDVDGVCWADEDEAGRMRIGGGRVEPGGIWTWDVAWERGERLGVEGLRPVAEGDMVVDIDWGLGDAGEAAP